LSFSFQLYLAKQLIFGESKSFAQHGFHKVPAAAGEDGVFGEIFLCHNGLQRSSMAGRLRENVPPVTLACDLSHADIPTAGENLLQEVFL
jgi:hypothetical protein